MSSWDSNSMNIASDLGKSFRWSWNPKLCKVQLSHSLEFNGGLIFNCRHIFHIFHTACWLFLIKWLWLFPQMIMNEANSGDEMHKSISAVRHLEPWGNYSFPMFSYIYIGGGFEFWLILIQSITTRKLSQVYLHYQFSMTFVDRHLNRQNMEWTLSF